MGNHKRGKNGAHGKGQKAWQKMTEKYCRERTRRYTVACTQRPSPARQSLTRNLEEEAKGSAGFFLFVAESEPPERLSDGASSTTIALLAGTLPLLVGMVTSLDGELIPELDNRKMGYTELGDPLKKHGARRHGHHSVLGTATGILPRRTIGKNGGQEQGTAAHLVYGRATMP